MKAIVLYIPKSDHGTMTENYVKEFKRFHGGVDISLLDAETREGVSLCKLYDILQYPALIVVNQDMMLQQAWLGSMFPDMNQVMSYMV